MVPLHYYFNNSVFFLPVTETNKSRSTNLKGYIISRNENVLELKLIFISFREPDSKQTSYITLLSHDKEPSSLRMQVESFRLKWWSRLMFYTDPLSCFSSLPKRRRDEADVIYSFVL